MNTSVIVNTNIVGGFKYANPMTGSLFLNQDDIVEKVRDQLPRYEQGLLNPREWYLDFATKAQRRLEAFLIMLW